MGTPPALACYAVVAPGLEPLTAAELEALLPARALAVEPGGIGFEATREELALANLSLRTASRVLVRLGHFHARALGELERKAALLPFGDWLAPGTTLRVRVTCHKSRLYHQKAIAERIVKAAGLPAAAPSQEEGDDAPEGTQLIVVRVLRDEVTVSLDSSGALLHRRGYRLATAKAPLRETLAAALVLASRWDPATPLLDPFCGAGTIAIEAALLAAGRAPGLGRAFQFRQWRGWPAAAEAALVARLTAAPPGANPAPIVASDRDAGAIRAAVANAERAGVADRIRFETRALSAVTPPPGPGALVSNPPYGVRVGEVKALRDLFARLGQLAREQLPGWTVTLLLPREPLERATGLRFEPRFSSTNGGLPVRAVTAVVDATGPGR